MGADHLPDLLHELEAVRALVERQVELLEALLESQGRLEQEIVRGLL